MKAIRVPSGDRCDSVSNASWLGTVIGPVAFDRFGDMVDPAVMVLRVRRRDGVSEVELYEGAAVDRVIRP